MKHTYCIRYEMQVHIKADSSDEAKDKFDKLQLGSITQEISKGNILECAFVNITNIENTDELPLSRISDEIGHFCEHYGIDKDMWLQYSHEQLDMNIAQCDLDRIYKKQINNT